ncbi:MAG TPA: PAS domain S-box protein [Deltaproteobacteria bacterium]|nr:PAS domain S-box protein [Deltaproteobacteria bacterium]
MPGHTTTPGAAAAGPGGIDRRGLIARLTFRLELYINLIVVPLAVYFGTIAGGFEGEKLSCILVSSLVAALLATVFGMSLRIIRLCAVLKGLDAPDADFASTKIRLLSYPAFESAVIALRWVFGMTCVYVMTEYWVGLSFHETLLVFLILVVCIPINSIISYCTTEHLLAPALMEERIRAVHLPMDSYTLFSVSMRTTLIVISVLIIPVVTLGYFLFSTNITPQALPAMGVHLVIILALSIAAVLVTVHESNAGIASGLGMTVAALQALERGSRDVLPIPLLTKGEIGVIGQYVNVLARSLKSSEEMLEKAFRSSPVGIAIWRLNGGVVLNVNESFTDITGYRLEDVAGRSVDELGLFTSPSEYERAVETLVQGEKVKNREMELSTKWGVTRTAAVSAEIITLAGESCIIAAMEDITEKRTLEREILLVGERERQKIGQDLHDDLSPHLIGIEVMSGLLKKRLEARQVPTIDEVEKIRALIEQAISKTRRLSRGLCPVFLADHGLESLLQEMSRTIAEVHGIECSFSYERPIVLEDITACTHIYYIVHEAVHNAVKHGKADRVDIELKGEGRSVSVTIRDNGLGMPQVAPATGMGLKIMRFRAHMIGAGLAIQSGPSGGTTVTLTLENAAPPAMS